MRLAVIAGNHRKANGSHNAPPACGIFKVDWSDIGFPSLRQWSRFSEVGFTVGVTSNKDQWVGWGVGHVKHKNPQHVDVAGFYEEIWCPHDDLNAGPPDYKSGALPTEL